MALLGKLVRRSGPVLLAFLFVAGFLNGPNPAISAPPPGTLMPFLPNNNGTLQNPFGTAASPGRLLVAECNGGVPTVIALDTAGRTITNSPLPATCGGGVESYIAVAPAPAFSVGAQGFPTVNGAGFVSNVAYITGKTANGPAIFQMEIDGTVPQTPLTTLPAASCSNLSGLTFDHTGAFQNDLIAVCSSGQVWTIGPVQNNGQVANFVVCPSGNCQNIATVPVSGGAVAEGPDIAPQCGAAGITCLPGLARQILIAVGSSSGSGKLYAVSNTGVVTAVISTSSPESAAFVPHPKCTFAPANAQAGPSPVYFVADVSNNTVDFLPFSVFTAGNFNGNSPGGNALVSTEGGKGVTLLTVSHKNLATSTFAASNSTLQGSAFVDCSIPFLLTGLIARQDQTINLQTGSGVVTVDILANNGAFNPLTICVGNGSTADGTLPCTGSLNVAPTYGFKGGEQSFAGCATKLTSSPSGLALACKFTKSQLDLPFDHFGGTLIMKLFYIGGGGDGDAEGGG